jgi:hypothetical protein
MLVNRLWMAAIAAIAVGLTTTALVRADQTSRTQYLTFSAPVALPGVTLHSGTYIFEVPEPEIAPDIVRVTSRDRKIVFLTAFTRSVDRPENVPLTQFVSLREAVPDQPSPIAVWWSDDRTGHQFVYEK